MKGLYNRIMFDDFSFGFKNALFISIYNKIEEENNRIKNKLQIQQHEIKIRFDKYILSFGEILPGDNNEIKEIKKLYKKNKQNSLKNKIKHSIINKLITEEEKLKFFINQEVSEYLRGIRSNIEIYKEYSKDIVKDLNYNVFAFIKNLKKNIEYKLSQNEMKIKFYECLEKAKSNACDEAEKIGEQINKSKDDFTEVELENFFNEIWYKIKNEAIKKINFQKINLDFNIEQDIKDKLEINIESVILNQLLISSNWEKVGIDQFYKDNILRLKKNNWLQTILQFISKNTDEREYFFRFHFENINEIKHLIALKKLSKYYEISLIDEIIKKTKDFYQKQKKKYNDKFKLKNKEYLDYLIIFACCLFLPILKEIVYNQKESLDIFKKLEQDKNQIKEIFINKSKNISEMKIQIDLIITFFKNNFSNFLKNKDNWVFILENYLSTKYVSKMELIKAMMKKNLEKDDIKSILKFSQSLKVFTREFLFNDLKKFIKENISNLLTQRKKLYINHIIKFIDKCKDFKDLKSIINFINSDLDYKSIFLIPIINRKYKINQEELLKKIIAQTTIYDFEIELKDKYNPIENCVQVIENFIYKIIGCEECCPFCGSICSYSIKDHKMNHTTNLHKDGSLINTFVNGTNLLAGKNCIENIITNKKFRHLKTKKEWVYYKNYQSIYPEWNIVTSEIPVFGKYWKFILIKFKDDICDIYKRDGYCNEDYFTEDDKRITKEDALNALK